MATKSKGCGSMTHSYLVIIITYRREPYSIVSYFCFLLFLSRRRYNRQLPEEEEKFFNCVCHIILHINSVVTSQYYTWWHTQKKEIQNKKKKKSLDSNGNLLDYWQRRRAIGLWQGRGKPQRDKSWCKT